MTKLQLLALERITKLIAGLHSEMCVRVPFFIEDKPDIEKIKKVVAEKDRESSRMWSEDNTAKREVVALLEALMAEKDEDEE